jgi:hypothetical protein
LSFWVLHETGTEKQQIPKLTSSTAEEMDSGRRPLPEDYRGGKGFHIAPQTPASSIANVRSLSSFASAPIITLDILADTYIDAKEYLDLSFLENITAFIPSREEVHRIWHPKILSEWMQEQAAVDNRCIAGRGQPASTLQPMKIALIPKTPPTAISIPAVARINEIPRLNEQQLHAVL